jgi:hypothetical protein
MKCQFKKNCLHFLTPSGSLWLQRLILWHLGSKQYLGKMFYTDSANIFINPRLACCETEKGGEGERDTDRTVKGVPPCSHTL